MGRGPFCVALSKNLVPEKGTPMTEKTHFGRLLLRLPQAARALAVSQRTLWGLTTPRGPIPCVRIGRSVRYAADDLQRWIDTRKEGGGKDE